MRKFLLYKILTAFCILAVSQSMVFAGAWSQKKGHFYTKFTLIYAKANKVFGSDVPVSFNDYSVYFYGEYGLLDRLTVSISSPSVKRSSNELNFVRGTTKGLLAGDVEAHLKYQFLDKPFVTAFSVGTKIPVVYSTDDTPPLGNGEMDFDLKLLLGTSFYPVPLYMTADIGYRKRGGNFIDEIHYNFEMGYTVAKTFLLRVAANGIIDTGTTLDENILFGFPLDQKQTRVGGGIIFLLTKNFELDVTYLKSLSGKNIPQSNEVFLGFAFKY